MGSPYYRRIDDILIYTVGGSNAAEAANRGPSDLEPVHHNQNCRCLPRMIFEKCIPLIYSATITAS